MEVLSFSHSRIKYLPSAIGKLNELKLLDLTGCDILRIDDGVLKNLVKLEELYMRVDGMNDLQEVLMESARLLKHSFYNLKVLDVIKCKNLRYLFTNPIASALMKLERLIVSRCPILEVLVYSENDGDVLIKFQELKLINFEESTKFETLDIRRMDKPKEIWTNEVKSSDEVDAYMLKKIFVESCKNLVNMFPRNLLSLLRHLEVLEVFKCGNIEVLFNIDMICVGDVEEFISNLRRTTMRIKLLIYSSTSATQHISMLNNTSMFPHLKTSSTSR
ncbi:hypothetical protein LXL04_010829 [Taraxacum kok-saghyz]